MRLQPLVRRSLRPVHGSSLLLAMVLAACVAPARDTNAPAELPAALLFPDDPSLLPGKGPVPKWKPFPKLWAQRRTEFWRHRDQDKGAVVFLGDSITQGWNDLARVFPELKTANRGIGGDTTRGVWFRLQEDVLDLEPAAVVLLIGINDLGNGGEPEDAAGNIRSILAALRKANPKTPIVVCKVMPSNLNLAKKIQSLNTLVDDAVKADPQSIRCDSWSIYANEDGTCKKEEFPDLLHPNKAGYEKWAAALKPILAGLELGAKKTE